MRGRPWIALLWIALSCGSVTRAGAQTATYVPLSGGTLTGPLNGTSLSMTGTIGSSAGNLQVASGKSLAFSYTGTPQYWYCVGASCTGQGNWTLPGNWLIQGSLQGEAGVVGLQTGGYTFAASDCGTTVWDYGATAAHTYTIPSGLPVGCKIDVVQYTTNVITFAAGSGETVLAPSGLQLAATAGTHAQVQVMNTSIADLHS